MKKIVFVTNMEPHKVGMLEAVNSADIAEITNLFEVIQVNDSELWTDRWQKLINDSAFVLFTWMGTGLSCDFFKKGICLYAAAKKLLIFSTSWIPAMICWNMVSKRTAKKVFSNTLPVADCKITKISACGCQLVFVVLRSNMNSHSSCHGTEFIIRNQKISLRLCQNTKSSIIQQINLLLVYFFT